MMQNISTIRIKKNLQLLLKQMIVTFNLGSSALKHFKRCHCLLGVDEGEGVIVKMPVASHYLSLNTISF